MNPLVEQFISEARDNLSYLDTHLHQLDGGDEEVINSLFRAAHTLKGGAGLIGLLPIQEITHAAEDLLDAYRNKQLAYSKEMLDTLFMAFDEVVELVDALEESGELELNADHEHIQTIKQSILGYLDPKAQVQESKQQESVALPFEINATPPSELLSEEKLLEIFEEIPLAVEKIDAAFADSQQLWILHIDLDRDTLILGNDPYYLLYLLGQESIKAIGIELNNCASLQQDPLQWCSRIDVVVKSSVENLENTFYNILDEIEFAPLSYETLFYSSYEPSGTELVGDFCKDILENGSADIEAKLEVVLGLVSEHTQDGFVLSRLKKLLNSKENTELIASALKALGYQHKYAKAQESNTASTSTKETAPNPQDKATKTTSVPRTIKIDQNEIDSLMDIIGEILVVKNSLPYIAQEIDEKYSVHAKRDLLSKYDDIDRITSQLQEKIMGMRLLPVSYIFNRYPKLVRDMSRQLEKEIHYEEFGADTRLDKMIIESIADPLVHIIRNSLDHGIESPQQRVAKGKDPKGLLCVGAKSEGDKVYIVIEDDGAGIDLEKVVAKALQKNLISSEELEKMSENEKLQLIFLPGLSTKEEITELSGRGVGTDAVFTIINQLGGKIALTSEPGKGSKTTIEIPISVALSSVFHVMLGKTNFALNMECISETVKVESKKIEYINNKPVLKLRGELIPLIFYFNLLSKDIKEQEEYSLLVVEASGVKYGFVVDRFVSQLDIVQKQPSHFLQNHSFISSTSLLGNGEVLFVINPSKIISQKEK